jgi:predicted protein tyrosine phosphatase
MSEPLRILFVCAMNRWRSPTAEAMYRHDDRLEVRSAGVRSEARRRLSGADMAWADVIFVMEHKQKSWIQERFRGEFLSPVIVLDIPDDYAYLDPELQRLLQAAIEPEIEMLLRGRLRD